MAETRAKARALRDAVNIGTAAFEELGAEDARDANAPAPAQRSRSTSSRAQRPEEAAQGEKCPECNAPAGKSHGSKCSRAAVAA
jgi:hypothetical protein